ncbi:hypothetical protein Emag_006452 [Eimeria magna]
MWVVDQKGLRSGTSALQQQQLLLLRQPHSSSSSSSRESRSRDYSEFIMIERILLARPSRNALEGEFKAFIFFGETKELTIIDRVHAGP